MAGRQGRLGTHLEYSLYAGGTPVEQELSRRPLVVHRCVLHRSETLRDKYNERLGAGRVW